MKLYQNKNWLYHEYIINELSAAKIASICKPEKILDDITPNSIRYVGNRMWWRKLPNGKYKNPDFKVTGQNKVIEVFGKYWHKNDETKELIDLYKQIGIDCLIFWENEIYNQQDLIKDKIEKFIEA